MFVGGLSLGLNVQTLQELNEKEEELRRQNDRISGYSSELVRDCV